MNHKEIEELKKQGYVIDKENTPLHKVRYKKDFWSSESMKRSPCYMCEFSDFDGKKMNCSQGHGPFGSIEETMFKCRDRELDDYYYDLSRVIFKKSNSCGLYKGET